MKIRFGEARKCLRTADIPAAREMIRQMDGDGMRASDYAALAAAAICGHGDIRVLAAEAEISLNCRVWNRFTDTSGRLDVWISFTAAIGTNAVDGMIIGGAYLTDIWDLNGQDDEQRTYHMYVRRFCETA